MLFYEFELSYILYFCLKNVVKALCWLVSLGTICICVFMPYDATKEGGISTSSWDKVQRAAYETLCKSAWAIALGWVIYACNTGCGGKSMLNHLVPGCCLCYKKY